MSYVYKKQDLEVEWVDGELNCLSQPMCATECGHKASNFTVAAVFVHVADANAR